jgi:hypothetical protein
MLITNEPISVEFRVVADRCKPLLAQVEGRLKQYNATYPSGVLFVNLHQAAQVERGSE